MKDILEYITILKEVDVNLNTFILLFTVTIFFFYIKKRKIDDARDLNTAKHSYDVATLIYQDCSAEKQQLRADIIALRTEITEVWKDLSATKKELHETILRYERELIQVHKDFAETIDQLNNR
ncbi:MAG: hypothetical protein ACREVA_02235 [Burkholderiales bacterium]